jgi:hypothetical protein
MFSLRYMAPIDAELLVVGEGQVGDGEAEVDKVVGKGEGRDLARGVAA